MDQSELDGQRSAYDTTFKFHDENALMLESYVRKVVRALRQRRPDSLVSLGIGQGVVCSNLLDEVGASVRRYDLVEGSIEAIRDLASARHLPPEARTHHTFFEHFEPDAPIDAIEMGFVLEHVDDPDAILARYARLLRPGGVAFVAVPNARSLHRLVGHRAGLLDDVYRLSAEDLALGHRRYYDQSSLVAALIRAGFKIAVVEGILLKPLTTSQFASLGLAPDVVEAFVEIASDFPDVSNAIYVEAVI